VPGLTDSSTIQTLQQRVRERRAFLIVDCGENDLVSNVLSTLANKTGADAPNSAFYFPWVLAPDPLQNGAIRAFPPSGFVAGIMARTDATRGVWKAPAGTEASLTGATGLAVTMSDAENGQLNPHAVNCLRTMPVYGNIVWGARTLHGDNDRGSEWKYVPVRRMALFLEESLYRGTQWVVFEPNDEPLWAQIRLNVGAFMQGLFRQGAFQGTSPRQAYFVKCDAETTTQADINLGIVNIYVGFAPLKPAEFVILKIQQIAGELAA
jgi:phage tail sheath protein FI